MPVRNTDNKPIVAKMLKILGLAEKEKFDSEISFNSGKPKYKSTIPIMAAMKLVINDSKMNW